MCTGRVDLAFVLHAFRMGADGVIIGGCWPGECHYVTEGNYDALANTYVCRKMLKEIGVNPDRLRLEWIAASEGARFAELMSDFAANLRTMGPLGESEGLEEANLRLDLDALSHLVPYLKLVEREKFRVPTRTEEAYRTFFESEEVDALFRQMFAEKLAISRILTLLEEKPLPTGEISERLGLTASEVSRHMNTSNRQGLTRFDFDRKCYALAAAD
jgi:coenzyme F420-reducing hydrogenase delta subunit